MGKKDKNKKKVSGSVKTALKTEKKFNAKQKKELAALGEDDIEKVVAQIEREEAKRQYVVEKATAPPSRRVNFTLTAHPFKEELIMLGGEFHDGRMTHVYGDMFLYNLLKNEWTILKAPGAPPPRCGHQALATTTNKGELWVFGGEFSSPSESQFYHYNDLWVFRFANKKWEKIMAPGPRPSARSGHRMTHIKKQLIVFGGFHDNLRDYRYYNDVYIFNLETYVWHNVELSGIPPHPRSGCILLPTSENKILIYGGYSKEKIKKDIDKGCIHSDMFLMTPDKSDETGLKWKWVSVKQSGDKISARCSASAILVKPNLAYLFGGVFDIEDNDEELCSRFYNDLVTLDLGKFQWHKVTFCDRKNVNAPHHRRKRIGDNNQNDTDNDDGENTRELLCTATNSTVIDDDDGIFTVTIGPNTTCITEEKQNVVENTFMPCPRINPGLAIKHNILYLYGGMFEEGDRQYTLNDFYSLDCRKLDEWRVIQADNSVSQSWLDSSDGSSTVDSDSSENHSEDEHMNDD